MKKNYRWHRLTEHNTTCHQFRNICRPSLQNTTPASMPFVSLKTLVRDKGTDESNEEYLKDVWPMVTASTDHDGARKLWLTYVTADPVGRPESAQNHYERLVLEDMNDEDSQVKRAKGRLDRRNRLMPVWHVLMQNVPPSRYVKVLREVTKGRRGEMTFMKMPIRTTTVAQIDQAVQSYDLEQHYYEEKRKKEVSQPMKTPNKANMRPSSNIQSRPPQQKAPGPQEKFPSQTAAANPQKKTTYLSREEYNKLTPEQKKALYESRGSGTGRPPK